MRHLLFFLLYTANLAGQLHEVQLPAPTGNFAVGTMTYEWKDTSRKLGSEASSEDCRTIIAQLWYPADTSINDVLAPYSAVVPRYHQVTGNSILRAGFARSVDQSNLIIISPGRGTERFVYTTLAEDLASHGFTVAAVDMPQVGYVVYGDGFKVKPNKSFRPPPGMMGGPYEKVDSFFTRPTALGLADLEFAYRNLATLNTADPDNRFTGKLNLDKIGIFGHSLGGRIAGEFTARHEMVKAYASMEGIPPRYVRYGGKIDIPIVMLCSSGTWPYAKENYFSLIDNRKQPVTMIEMNGYAHNSVTDNALIFPKDYPQRIAPQAGLETSRKVVTSYFISLLTVSSLDYVKTISALPSLKITHYD